LQSGNEKLGLKIDSVGKKLAQLFHFGRVLRLEKFGARLPRTNKFAGAEKELWQLGSATGDKADQFRKTFFKWTARSFWVPDKMANTEGSEVFPFVPRSKPGDGSVAFVLPDFPSDFRRFGLRQGYGSKSLSGGDEQNATDNALSAKSVCLCS